MSTLGTYLFKPEYLPSQKKSKENEEVFISTYLPHPSHLAAAAAMKCNGMGWNRSSPVVCLVLIVGAGWMLGIWCINWLNVNEYVRYGR